jgi:ABC-2 type transport system ATP-binding protein
MTTTAPQRGDLSVIETKGLRRSFKTRKGNVEAVAGIDLRVDAGEIVGFLGPNGAGKTTTLRMLTTLLEPSGGEATVAGCDLLREPRTVRERIGYVAQGGSTDPTVTGRRELVLQARLYGMDRATAEARAAEVLAGLDLDACADRKCGTYSGGQRRRLDLGLGLVHKPPLLFLDEPTTGLDPQSRAHLWNEIRELREHGTTVFITTHYLDEADALCDRLAIIDQGRIVAEGTAVELKREIAGDVVTVGVVEDVADALRLLEHQPFVREATLDEGAVRLYVERGEAAMPQILRLLDGGGLTLQTISLARPSLDDVFLRQTGRSLRDEAA